MAFSVSGETTSKDDEADKTTMTRYPTVDRSQHSPPAIVVGSSGHNPRCLRVDLSSHTSRQSSDDNRVLGSVGGACTSLPSLAFALFGLPWRASARPALLLARFRTGNGSEQGGRRGADKQKRSRRQGESVSSAHDPQGGGCPFPFHDPQPPERCCFAMCWGARGRLPGRVGGRV